MNSHQYGPRKRVQGKGKLSWCSPRSWRRLVCWKREAEESFLLHLCLDLRVETTADEAQLKGGLNLLSYHGYEGPTHVAMAPNWHLQGNSHTL